MPAESRAGIERKGVWVDRVELRDLLSLVVRKRAPQPSSVPRPLGGRATIVSALATDHFPPPAVALCGGRRRHRPDVTTQCESRIRGWCVSAIAEVDLHSGIDGELHVFGHPGRRAPDGPICGWVRVLPGALCDVSDFLGQV